MLRSFMPVGQGIFTVEHFKDLTIVFNCGGSKISLINKQIKDILEPKTIINALFITNLKNCYTNGLEFLLKNYKVNNIIIPYMNKDEKLLTLAMHLIYGKVNNNFIQSLFTKNNEFKDLNIIEIVGNSFFKFKDFCDQSNENWIFYVYNYQNRNKVKKFKEGLRKYHLDNISVSNIYSLSGKEKDLLKKILREEVGGLTYSNNLTIYSGPNNNKLIDYSINSYERKMLKGGCIYMGDLNVNDRKNYEQFYQFFYNFNDYVGTIYLPHHGSRNHYHHRLCLDFDARFIASCSHRLLERFPSKEVLRSIIHHNKPLYIIDEKTHPYEQIIGDKNL